jgi:hypothetical protein
MTTGEVLVRVTAVGMIIGAAIAPVAPRSQTEVVLLSADEPLSGSDTAIILGGTFMPTPSIDYAQAAENLYLNPLGFLGGALDSTVCDMSGTDPCSAPLQVLTTPELILEGPSTQTDTSDIVLAVKNEIEANPGAFSAEHPLTIFGYSQSAGAETLAMSRLQADGIPLQDLHFVFIGDPSTPGGVWPNMEADLVAWLGPSDANAFIKFFELDGALGIQTLTDLYPTTIYTLDTDGVADWQEDYDAGGMNAGGFLDSLEHFLLQHAEYLGLTASQTADATTSADGNLTYIDISDNINNGAAWLEALSHGLVDSGLFQSLFASIEFALSG